MDDYYRDLKLTSIVLSSGGVYGLQMLYVLDKLDSMGALSTVQHWSGVSIGSICSLFMNIGVKPIELVPLIQKVPTSFTLTPQSILSTPDTFGLVSHTPFRRLLETVLEQKGILPNITFCQLFRFTKQTLSIFATNLDTNSLTAFNHQTTPDVYILDAIMASCSIPIVFPPFSIQKQTYIDGAILSDWAVDPNVIADGSRTLLIHPFFTHSKHSVTATPTTSFIDYIQYLFSIHSQNVERLTDPMRQFKSTIRHIVTIPFDRQSFDLSCLEDAESNLQKKAIEVLQESIVTNS